jgi:hypothetical protein
MWRLIVLAGSIALLAALALPVSSAGAAQIGHDHFTSDPYPDNWCGIDGTSVDQVVANYTEDGSRTSLNVTTLFTATTSGKSMEIRQTGLRREGAPIDNGDGTYSVVHTNAGQSPSFKLPNGPVIALDVGLIEGVATFDSTTGDFISFEIVKLAGPRPNACDAIVAALS